MGLKIVTNDMKTPMNEEHCLIKVVGVGGGGCNAVNYMEKVGVEGCQFIVCNTDAQVLNDSPVETKIRLGGGLGAGAQPEIARNLTLESSETIERILFADKPSMIFITAGMGGGTGTGASPIIAKMAKEKGILTVGVITVPFRNEGSEIYSRAVDGIQLLKENVDSLIIIDNEKLYSNYENVPIHEALPKVDEVLATAVRSVTEIISKKGLENVDFRDISNMMKSSGMAIIGTGNSDSENRVRDAVDQALSSELLYDLDLSTAKNVLVNITVPMSQQGFIMKELKDVNDYIKEKTGKANFFKRGIILDNSPERGENVSITIIATGFKMANISNIVDIDEGNLVTIDSDFKATRVVSQRNSVADEARTTIKIGLSSTLNKRRFNFNGVKPALCVKNTDDISSLENMSAIRRNIK